MADAVGSAVAQEAVSRAVSFVLSNHEAAASKRRNIERLEMAHTELEFALERSRKLPITDMSLLRQRRSAELFCIDASCEYWKTKRLSKGLKKDELSCSDVGRFEWFTDKAGKFVRDVETGCSLEHYRFLSPLIRHLLEGKTLWYEQVRRSRTNRLLIAPVWSEERGVEAWMLFLSEDRMTPKKKIYLVLLLRLSESTDVVGITTKCLQSLGPVFKPFAEVAVGELAQLPTQRVSRSAVRTRLLDNFTAACLRPDPLCCGADGHGCCANNTMTSKFPAEVTFMCFNCHIPAFEYNLQSSAEPLELCAAIAPHYYSCNCPQKSCVIETIGGREERINGSLRQIEEMQLTNAIDRFICQPKLTAYTMIWRAAPGLAVLVLRKLLTEMPETKAGLECISALQIKSY